ncbi:T9SS type B sorting domain-containing protein [Flavobacterium facile]|uniref:T9SS type B sorting domain-containing protein n=1 Tax=Flavobacterium facile TaxID=2893174 RepID=UPI002E7A30D7|nr:T9SS type B sorting domain-containing protein [Flavobacterium sp. T-12]
MKNFFPLYILLFLSFNLFSQQEEKICSTIDCNLHKNLIFKTKNSTNSNQIPTEICTNGGFEDYEIIGGETVLKNFNSKLYYYDTDSFTNEFNIPILNPTNQFAICATVSNNYVDPFLGSINGFNQYVLRVGKKIKSEGGRLRKVQAIRFKSNKETELIFNYKVVVQNSFLEEDQGAQPYFLARILNMNDELISYFQVYADPSECNLAILPDPNHYAIIGFQKYWRTGRLDISSIPNLENFKVEFISGSCSLGCHYAYAFIDDICIQQAGTVALNPFNISCPASSFDVCGTFTLPESDITKPVTVSSIVLNVYDENQNIVYSNSNPTNLNLTNNTFCFNLNLSNFPNIINANYNVGVVVNYENSNSSCFFNFSPAIDNDASPGYDISFNNCYYPCNLVTQDFNITVCDILNDGVQTLDLSQYNSNLANSSNYSFNYYRTLIGAQNQIAADQIIDFRNYNQTQSNNIIYVRISFSNVCFQIVALKLELVSTPIIPINDIYLICEGSFITLNGGNNYDSYTWSTGETSQQITITKPGNYSVTVTENHGTTICSSTKNFTLLNSNIATIQEIISTDWTDYNNTITVLLNSNSQGDYEYSLNGIDFQDSNVFSNLEAGEYTVFVRDKNGCGMVSEELYLLMYPKFFTPNGDGYNEYWKIKFSKNNPILNIKIFDRYGKLLKQLETDSIGWDGTYLGKDMPSSDYWFVITRENGKELKGHFTLKR